METSDFVKSIKSIKIIAITAMILLAMLTIIMTLLFIVEKNNKEEKIYVSTDIGTFMVKRGEMNARQSWEVKNHIKNTIQNLFENDIYTYRGNLESALNMMDNNMGIKIKDMLNKSGLYDLLKKENAYTKILFDSVIVKQMIQPYQAKAYFKQTVMWRGLNQVIPYGVLITVSEDSRNEKNPYGLLVNRFDLIRYEPAIDGIVKSEPDSLKGSR